MTKTSILATACTVLFLASGAIINTSQAESNASYMQACSTQWKSMKTAGTVPAGQKWSDFLKTCSASTPVAAVAPTAVAPAAVAPTTTVAKAVVPAVATPAPAPTTIAAVIKKAIVPAVVAPAAKAAAVAPKTGSAGQLAEQTRIKECGSEWKAAKASNTVPAGQTWPQYWSACDARLKG